MFDTMTAVKASHILLVSITNPRIPEISMASIDGRFKMKMYRDRFDLADVITKSSKSREISAVCNPLKLISLMTWDAKPLASNDCEIVLNHFESVENMFKLSKEALEYSINALKISDKSKHHIISFMTGDQDYYINY